MVGVSLGVPRMVAGAAGPARRGPDRGCGFRLPGPPLWKPPVTLTVGKEDGLSSRQGASVGAARGRAPQTAAPAGRNGGSASEPEVAPVWPGRPYPLGATFDGSGTNFSLFSEVADGVELCLFDAEGRETRHALPEVTGHVWHGYVPTVTPGQRYGYRVHGPWRPADGLRCNPAKLLLDPYAKAIEGDVNWDPACYPYVLGDPDRLDDRDSAPFVQRSVVINPFFDWSEDRSPRTALHRTVIYEAHVKGFTRTHPEIPEALRGTYAGLAHPAAIRHLRSLGVTAIELMPVHQFIHEQHLVDRGLRNYWGYSTIGFLAPHNEYSSTGQAGDQVGEFKAMVRELHRAGIEVILDVVYNHTAEGNHLGPMLAFKGIDNAAYYRLMADDGRHYMDYTGTGNSLNVRHPHVLQLIMDSLRYWVLEMHVDGFRFDLATALARELHDVDRLSAFFDLIHQDPVISQVKLIAEPWDVGEGGYHVGNFPVLWSEWNGRYRDEVRDLWRGEPATMADFAYRITGSSDLYEGTGRRPYASINFVTAHDGFTLADLVAYHEKRNQANGEENRDGESHNRSWNCGAEGPTDDPAILALRRRQCRNILATLFLSQGVPMLLGGDELGRTQGGNNNAYCQDNELSWTDWSTADEELIEFTRRLIELRRAHAVFRRRRFFQGQPIHGIELVDIEWFTSEGVEMAEERWGRAHIGDLGVLLNGDAIPSRNERGERIRDDTFYLVFNAHGNAIDVSIPPDRGERWELVLDTAREPAFPDSPPIMAQGDPLHMPARSVVVLRRVD
jgi:isoamylase